MSRRAATEGVVDIEAYEDPEPAMATSARESRASLER